MSEEQKIQKMDSSMEISLVNIDEDRLPQVLSQRLELLEQTNLAYEEAKNREKIASDKVVDALLKADELISSSQTVGKHAPVEHKFLWIEWTSKRDEIEALKSNLQEIIAHGEDSAIAQKNLVEVQMALAESQAALLKVQETQMVYQGQIADATKFLYGLSAYNMASVQSVLINLKAVLSGASKEKLGEMAKQQLLLVMDQIKNQESIVMRLRENEEILGRLDVEFAESSSNIADLQKHDAKQDSIIAELQKQDEEQDDIIEDLLTQDEEQDKLIAQNAEKVKENAQLILETMEVDEEQDKLIAQNAERVNENARRIQESMEADEAQDRLLEQQQEKDVQHDQSIDELQKQVLDLTGEIEQLRATLSNKGDKMLVHIATGVAVVAFIAAVVGLFI